MSRHKDTCEDDCSQLDRVRELEGQLEQAERALGDPAYQYAGSRIPRTAIEARNKEIMDLLAMTEGLRTQLAQAEEEVELLKADVLDGDKLMAQAEQRVRSILRFHSAEFDARPDVQAARAALTPPPAEEAR